MRMNFLDIKLNSESRKLCHIFIYFITKLLLATWLNLFLNFKKSTLIDMISLDMIDFDARKITTISDQHFTSNLICALLVVK